MCDTIAGELLVSFHETDVAAKTLIEDIRVGRIPHVRLIDDLRARFARMNLSMRRNMGFEFCRLGVPPGQEAFKINYLQFFYKHAVLAALGSGRMGPVTHQSVLSYSNFHLQVVPHSILSIRSTSSLAPGIGFSFTQTHTDYKKILGWKASTTSSGIKRVLVLDTGLDANTHCAVISRTNFVDDAKANDVTDDHGHGTAVVSVINDLCPSAGFIVYKVADANGRASEWDTLAALAADTGADVVNISLAFGLPDTLCAFCGRESHSSRSAVFENMIGQLSSATNGPLMVAAAGNDALPTLSFPARFSHVIAIISANKAKELSSFTNHGAVDHVGDPHRNVFVLPGGEKQQNLDPTEYVGTSASGQLWWGTSFAAAYASGLIASLWSQSAHAAINSGQLLDHLRRNADTSLPKFSQTTHGNGLMRFK
jgi:subtilisin family serine protease